jgi:hypothetical protein
VFFSSPPPFAPGSLNGASNSITIPPNSLPGGTALIGHLSIGRPGFPSTNYAVGISAFGKDTEFPLSTRPDALQPRLELLSPEAGQTRVRVIGEADRRYHLQASADLHLWEDILTTNTTSAELIHKDPDSAGLTRRFYRVQVGP